MSIISRIMDLLFAPLRRRPKAALIAMRLADMHHVHPQQITARCSSCGEDIGIYPSGQDVMRRFPDVELFCQICNPPNEEAALAPGAEHEPWQSVRKR